MEQRWFMASLARELQHSAAAAVEFIADEYREIVNACESERKANRWMLPILEDAAMFVTAIAAENRDHEALVLAAQEFRFWAEDAAEWAEELIDVL